MRGGKGAGLQPGDKTPRCPAQPAVTRVSLAPGRVVKFWKGTGRWFSASDCFQHLMAVPVPEQGAHVGHPGGVAHFKQKFFNPSKVKAASVARRAAFLAGGVGACCRHSPGLGLPCWPISTSNPRLLLPICPLHALE